MDPPSILRLFLSLPSFLFFVLMIFVLRPKPRRSEFQPYPLVGHLPQFLRNRHRFLDWMTDALAASPTNTVAFRRPGNVRGVITANPLNVEHMLRSGFDNFPKGPRFAAHLHDFLGRGIFNSDGPLWLRQRKIASFEFSTRSLRSYVVHTVRAETSSRLLPLLRQAAAAARTIDLQDVLERYAFDNICKVAFGEDPACLAGELPSSFATCFKDAAELSAGRFRYAVPGFWKVKKLLNAGSERRLQESIAAVHGFAMEIIRSRRKDRRRRLSGDDLLSRFMEGEDKSEEFLRDIVVSFILAGRDTTSSALTWFFWLLSLNPEVEARILQEIRSVRRSRSSGDGDNGLGLEFEELKEMEYMQAAITEAMRLYPPVPVNSTECREATRLPDGTEVGEGWFVSYSSYAMGRMEGIWGEDCREFRPERWLEEGGRGRFRPESPFRYPVFHGGPRMCLGKEMAYIQMKSIAACVIQGFEIEVRDKRKIPEQMLSLTLRMRGGLAVRVRERGTDVE